MNGFAGADWLRAQGIEPSSFGAEVADILGLVFRGIYHIDRCVLRTDWSRAHYVELRYEGELATWDRGDLTEMVLLCHRRAIRLSIGSGMRALRLLFTRRHHGPGASWERHPTVAEAVDSVADLVIEYGSPAEKGE